MHLLAGDVARIDDGDAAIDLGLPPGDIVFLSAADTELALIGKIAAERGSDAPSVRFANLGRLSHPMSVDHFLEATVRHAKHVVVRCMGGASYWSYGLVELRRICHMYRISCTKSGTYGRYGAAPRARTTSRMRRPCSVPPRASRAEPSPRGNGRPTSD